MRSFKTGLVSAVFAAVVGMAAVIGCSADGGDGDTTEQDPATPAPTATLPPSSSGGNNPPQDAGKDASKKDAGKPDAAKDAGPPPPTAGDPCVTANEIKTKSCGVCGKATTVCLDDGTTKKWSDYSDCTGELANGCVPGTTQACGNCGTQTCTQFCGFNSCTGQPANSCSPGDVTLVGAGCTTGTYRQQTCKADCTQGNISLTCEAPPTFVTVPAAAGAVTSSIITTTSTTVLPRLTGSCPNATVSTTDSTPYNFFEVRNTTGKAVTVSIYQSQVPGGPLPDTLIAAYAGATPPTTDAARKACLVGVNDFGTSSLTGSSLLGSLDSTNGKTVAIPAGSSVTVYSANYYTYDAGDPDAAVGVLKLNVRTETIAP